MSQIPTVRIVNPHGEGFLTINAGDVRPSDRLWQDEQLETAGDGAGDAPLGLTLEEELELASAQLGAQAAGVKARASNGKAKKR